MEFRHLAALLALEVKFFGTRVPTEKRNADFVSSIENIAEYYADALITHRPEGPFALGGWSAGRPSHLK